MDLNKFYNKYFILGTFFLVLQILILIRNQILNDPILFFYYCDHIPLLFAIGFYSKNIQLIKAMISVGLILQGIYLIDLFGGLFGHYLTGTTKYLGKYTLFPLIVSLTMHITTIIALIFTYKEKTNSKSLTYAFIYTTILYIATITLTPINYDMNCIFNACKITFLQFENYTNVWILLSFTLLTVPTYLFQKLLNKLSKN